MIVIDAPMFRAMIRSGAMDLQRHCDEVNNLNVFPVPDGDTGVNMFATLKGGVEAIESLASPSLGEGAKALSRGMLLAARGNSGVILSQFFAGLAQGLEPYDKVNVLQFAQAFDSGVKRAYEVVVRPVEGTILTVMREGGASAFAHIDSGTSFEDYFIHLVQAMKEALFKTPDLLPVLKEAGVIDSGGAGLLYIVEGMAQALGGRIIEDVSLHLDLGQKPADTSAFNEDSELDYGYCTEFILQLTNAKGGVDSFDLEKAIAFFESIGDSLVAFRDGTIVKVHVHTKEPDKAIAYALQFGEFVKFKMENMTLQHEQTLIDKSRSIASFAKPDTPRKAIASLAVVPTKEIGGIFKDYGVDEVINVGNLMNPGTEDFVMAFKALNADDIFVFPNNKNEIMVAEMAAGLFPDSKIHVIPTASVAEGLSAACIFDAGDLGVKENLERVEYAIKHCSTLCLYVAAKDTHCRGVAIAKGDYVYAPDEDTLVSAPSLFEAFKKWFEAHVTDDSGLLQVIYSANVSEEDKEAISSLVEDSGYFVELSPFEGGASLYDIFAILD